MSQYAPVSEDTTLSGYQQPSGWAGWIMFAGIFMILGGTMNAVSGLVALINDEWTVWANGDALSLDLTQWGWVHLILGLAVVLSGFGVFTGNVLARTVGVVAASLSLLANFAFLPAYPFWSATIMVVDTLIIWALIVHGGELREV